MSFRSKSLLVLFALAVPFGIEAQNLVRNPAGLIGFSGSLARPVGEFQDFVDWGGGVGAYGVWNIDRRRQIGIRAGGSFVIYGHESYDTQILPHTQRVLVEVNTDNFIVDFGIGPQITLGRGPIKPYMYGTVGFSYFATVSSLDGVSGGPDFAHTTNFDDFTAALTGGGGLLLQLTRGRHPVSIDLSTQWTFNGDVDYLTEGDIVDNPDGSLTLYPIRSEANLMTFRIGIAVGM